VAELIKLWIMMKLNITGKILLASILIVFASSCTINPCWTKWMYLNNYDSFMKKLEQKKDKLSEKEWEKMDERYEAFATTCKEKYWKEMTREEKDRIIENNMKYLMLRVESKFSGNLFKGLEKEINSFVKNIDKEKVDQNMNEIKKTWDSFKKKHAKDVEMAFTEMGQALEEIGKEVGESAEK
jgi:hypothetical protein